MPPVTLVPLLLLLLQIRRDHGRPRPHLKNLLLAMSRMVLIPSAWASSSASFSLIPASAEGGGGG